MDIELAAIQKAFLNANSIEDIFGELSGTIEEKIVQAKKFIED